MIFGSLYIRVELILVPAYIAILFMHRGANGIMLPCSIWPLVLLWALMLCITLVTSVLGLAVTPAWFNAYSYIKPALIILLFANARFNEQDLQNLLKMFAITAIPLAVLAVGQTFGIKMATDITMSAYMSPERVVIKNLFDTLGFILRAVCVFEHPSSAATYFLTTLTTSIFLLFELHGQRQYTTKHSYMLPMTSLFASFLGGVFTLSATFVAGIGLIFFLLFLRLGWRNKIRAIMISVAFGIIIMGYQMSLGKNKNYASITGNINYQITRVINFELFKSRYANHTGFLLTTMEEIKDNPLIGYGWMRKPRVFIGDSMYVVLLYQGGFIGMVLFALFLVMTYRLVSPSRTMQEIFFFWLFVLLISGMGMPSFFIPRLNDWWWALCGIGVGLAGRSIRTTLEEKNNS